MDKRMGKMRKVVLLAYRNKDHDEWPEVAGIYKTEEEANVAIDGMMNSDSRFLITFGEEEE